MGGEEEGGGGGCTLTSCCLHKGGSKSGKRVSFHYTIRLCVSFHYTIRLYAFSVAGTASMVESGLDLSRLSADKTMIAEPK